MPASSAALIPQPSATALRAGHAGDLGALLDIENAVFDSDRLSRRSMRHHLAGGASEILVAVDRHDVPCAYALLSCWRRAKVARLDSLAVRPALFLHGLGSRLLAACEDRAQARHFSGLRLEVRADNRRAITLYERRGYEWFGEIHGYYQDCETALLFVKWFA